MTEVDGLAPEFKEAARRYLGKEGAKAFFDQNSKPSVRMARASLSGQPGSAPWTFKLAFQVMWEALLLNGSVPRRRTTLRKSPASLAARMIVRNHRDRPCGSIVLPMKRLQVCWARILFV